MNRFIGLLTASAILTLPALTSLAGRAAAQQTRPASPSSSNPSAASSNPATTYAENTAYGFVDYPDEVAAATAQATVNAGGFAHVVYQSARSAEDADNALAKSTATRPPEHQKAEETARG